jgi:hypothetical protein
MQEPIAESSTLMRTARLELIAMDLVSLGAELTGANRDTKSNTQSNRRAAAPTRSRLFSRERDFDSIDWPAIFLDMGG